MKQKIIFFMIFSLFSLFLAAQAVLDFEKKEINFGEIDEGEVINLEFKFKNSGDSLLIIKNIRPSCGCTVARLKQKKYKPGEEGIIPVRFISTGFGGMKVFKTIAVNSNDFKNSYIRLSISGTVSLKNFARIEITPDQIDFNKIHLGKPYSLKISIKNTGNKNLEIIEVSHIPDITLAFGESVIKPNGSTEVNIIYKPMNRGNTPNFIKLRTNAHRQYYSLIKVDAEIKD